MVTRTALRLVDGDHVVQFFTRDPQLDDMVGGYLAAAALADEAVVVVATAERRQRLLGSLLDAGVPVSAALADGRLTLLDAAATLDRLCVDGVPDPALFDAVVGATVRDAAALRPVRAYGEMVALLWEAGDLEGAMRLEGLWHDLGQRVPFALFCAYPTGPGRTGALGDVGRLHSDVIAGAPVAAGAEEGRRFASNRQAPGLARRFVRETLRDWGLANLVDDGELVATELAANAVVHVGSDFTVTLARVDDGVDLVVGDTSRLTPQPGDPRHAVLGGHGLHLVGAITADWGHELVPGGKVVWAQLR